jgi:hypothetical protein
MLGRLRRAVVPAPKRRWPEDFGPEEVACCEAALPFTMTSPERIIALRDAVRHVVRAGIPGDLVECGVWRGGSMFAAARTLLEIQAGDRHLHLFDTFEGMPPPGESDVAIGGQHAADLLEREDRATSLNWAFATLDDVRRTMARSGYDPDRVHYHVGRVEQTIPDEAPERIALLRLDTDWYESTRHELDHLWPRLQPGGILIIDDYGHWQGARRAVDEFLARAEPPLYLHRIDYTGRLLIKPRVER